MSPCDPSLQDAPSRQSQTLTLHPMKAFKPTQLSKLSLEPQRPAPIEAQAIRTATIRAPHGVLQGAKYKSKDFHPSLMDACASGAPDGRTACSTLVVFRQCETMKTTSK